MKVYRSSDDMSEKSSTRKMIADLFDSDAEECDSASHHRLWFKVGGLRFAENAAQHKKEHR